MKRILAAAALIVSASLSPAIAAEQGSGVSPRLTTVPQPIAFDRGEGRVLLTMIGDWIAHNFDRPAPSVLPRVAFVPAGEMAALRFRLAGLSAHAGDQPVAVRTEHVAALYDRRNATIYLPEGWAASNPGEVSVLVHEMAHHLDELAAADDSHPADGEQFAYTVQDRWLWLFGEDLESAFGIDLFSMLMHSAWTY
jgi:hypothetical protein